MNEKKTYQSHSLGGILLVNKPKGDTSFHLVARLRRLTGIRKIGHTGTLDPFATGVMVLLLGRDFTRLSDQLLAQDKEYIAEVRLGIATDTFDSEGTELSSSTTIPSTEEIEKTIQLFQGEIQQIPPMYSAKKIGGKKLYDLARSGKTVERQPMNVRVQIHILSYRYPHLHLRIACSKGTYIRSLAHDIGRVLKCGAHLSELQRVRNGNYTLEQCVDGALLHTADFNPFPHLLPQP